MLKIFTTLISIIFLLFCSLLPFSGLYVTQNKKELLYFHKTNEEEEAEGWGGGTAKKKRMDGRHSQVKRVERVE